MTTPHTAYLAKSGLAHLLLAELSDVVSVHGDLILAKGPAQRVYWCQNVWHDVQQLPVTSISDAAQKLKSLQRNWCPYVYQLHRRTQLIEDALPHVSAKPLRFLDPPKPGTLGAFTLIGPNQLLACTHTDSFMPLGKYEFIEDKLHPPSRAYLKLWEAFTRFQFSPSQEVCLDLGASPGGWSWVLAQSAKRVYAFDRSPLDPRVAQLSNVTHQQLDAFSVDVASFPEARWVFSDVICYPQKLLQFAQRCVEKCPDKNYLFTIKFQGETDTSAIAHGFEALGGTVVHLYHNKHELTWIRRAA